MQIILLKLHRPLQNLHSCVITPKTGAGAYVHSDIKCDIEHESYSEVQ